MKIVEFKISQIIIFNFLQNDNMNLLSVSKSEKFSDLFMFNSNQKKLCSFVMKLYLKLQENADRYSMK